jgi:hypothetical protein
MATFERIMIAKEASGLLLLAFQSHKPLVGGPNPLVATLFYQQIALSPHPTGTRQAGSSHQQRAVSIKIGKAVGYDASGLFLFQLANSI